MLALVPLFLVSMDCSRGPARPIHAPSFRDWDDGARVERDERCEVLHEITLETEGDVELDTPALSGDDSGTLLLSWIALRDPGQRAVLVQRLDETLRPRGPATELPSPEGMASAPSVTTCGGRGLLAYQVRRPEGEEVWVAELSGHGPAEPMLVAPQGRGPAIACLGDSPVLAWSSREGSIEDVFVRWLDRGGTEAAPVRVTGETDSGRSPAICCGDGESCLLSWSDMREGVAEIFGALIAPGAGPSVRQRRLSPSNRAVSGAGGAYEPACSQAGDGRRRSRGFLLAWHDRRSHDEAEVYVAPVSRSLDPGGATRISVSVNSSTAPAIADCTSGSAVAWRDRSAGPPAVFIAPARHSPMTRARASAARQVSRLGADESSRPAVSCLGTNTVVSWTESSEEGGGNRVRLAVVSCR